MYALWDIILMFNFTINVIWYIRSLWQHYYFLHHTLVILNYLFDGLICQWNKTQSSSKSLILNCAHTLQTAGAFAAIGIVAGDIRSPVMHSSWYLQSQHRYYLVPPDLWTHRLTPPVSNLYLSSHWGLSLTGRGCVNGTFLSLTGRGCVNGTFQ